MCVDLIIFCTKVHIFALIHTKLVWTGKAHYCQRTVAVIGVSAVN